MNNEMSIGQLAKSAGVTTRTIRFYVAEGLLAKPEKKGTRQVYSSLHLTTLKLISAMKAMYLPLWRIGQELEGTTESDMLKLLEEIAASKGTYNNPFHPLPPILRSESGQYLLRETPAEYNSASPAPPVHADLPPPEYIMSTENWKRIQIRPGVELHFKAARDPNFVKWIEHIVVHARKTYGDPVFDI